jgi:hypothetical protein
MQGRRRRTRAENTGEGTEGRTKGLLSLVREDVHGIYLLLVFGVESSRARIG